MDNERFRTLLAELGELYGVLPQYWNIQGQCAITSDETRAKLLQAMGVACSTEEEIEGSLLEFRRKRWQRLLEPVILAEENSDFSAALHVPRALRDGLLKWSVEHETQGRYAEGSIELSSAVEEEGADLDNVQYVRLCVRFGVRLPFGYHRLSIEVSSAAGSADAGASRARVLLLVPPEHCYLPENLLSGRKAIGISGQLYSLTSSRNWGIGDFSDLKDLLAWSEAAELAFVGLNPLHAVSPRGDAGSSPYSPVSRVVLNPLYIDIAAAAQMLHAAELLAEISSADFQDTVRELRGREFVAYGEVAAVKFAALEKLYRSFAQAHAAAKTAQGRDFEGFCAGRGEELEQYAAYCAIAEHLRKHDPECATNWKCWPAEYRDRRSAAVRQFCEENRGRLNFYKFLEWLAHNQLQAIRSFADRKGMEVGLYLDVALGAAGGGAEGWVNQHLYAFQASMGAPADKLAPQGQDWGLPPFIPHRLREAEYRPFLQMLRAAMRYAGALRIDHAMALMRLYWVPGPGEAKNGAYVRYALDEMMAVLAIESRRQKCLVIGEDLGTVPDEVRAAMARRKVLSYKVLYFMKDYQRGRFLAPGDYASTALTVTSTHDLATLKGYWEEHDLKVRKELELHEPEVLAEMFEERKHDRRALLEILVEQGLLAPEVPAEARWQNKRMPPELSRAVHLFLARTPSVLQAVQLEDVLLLLEQANLPGTTTEHANWQRKVPVAVEKLRRSRNIRKFIAELTAERKK